MYAHRIECFTLGVRQSQLRNDWRFSWAMPQVMPQTPPEWNLGGSVPYIEREILAFGNAFLNVLKIH